MMAESFYGPMTHRFSQSSYNQLIDQGNVINAFYQEYGL